MKTNYEHIGDWNEAKIIDAVLEFAERAALLISVFDGEEYQANRVVTADAARTVVGVSDETTIVFHYASDRQRVGHVELIHGNGVDVLSDFGWSARNRRASNTMHNMWKHVKEVCGL